jgi:hypothetical protein
MILLMVLHLQRLNPSYVTHLQDNNFQYVLASVRQQNTVPILKLPSHNCPYCCETLKENGYFSLPNHPVKQHDKEITIPTLKLPLHNSSYSCESINETGYSFPNHPARKSH